MSPSYFWVDSSNSNSIPFIKMILGHRMLEDLNVITYALGTLYRVSTLRTKAIS
jgi:hypothetical protein